MYDILIKDGTIINGTGGSLLVADVGIKDGNITAIGKIKQRGKKEINAAGLYVAPGFIDFHSHNDRVLLNKKVLTKITQGITSEVIGNCGLSAVPYLPGMEQKEKDCLLGKSDIVLPELWRDYIGLLKKSSLITNVIPLVGHGNIRSLAMGFENRPARKDELDLMKKHLAEIMETGCWGMSTGLIYPPGIFTPEEELLKLCSVLKRFGGIYASHIRGKGSTLFQAVGEVLSIGERKGIPVHISHLKSPPSATDRLLGLLYAAHDKGIKISYDQYPYTASSTTATILLPPWMYEGGERKLLKRLADKGDRERAYNAMQGKDGGEQTFFSFLGPEKIMVNQVGTLKNRKYEGKTLLRVSMERGERNPIETLFNLLTEERGSVSMIFFSMNEESVKKIMKQKIGFVGTDGLPGRRPHPRLWGAFTRILGKYVREENVLTLDEAVYKFSRAPAEKLKLKGRGEIKKGNVADIVIFDAGRVKDMATFENPTRKSKGIEYVIVNGACAVEKGRFTGARSGRLLLRGD